MNCRPPSTFAGRTSDLAVLRDALNRARSGHGSTIFLAGAGGVGKTRLSQIIADEAGRAKLTVAAGRAYPVESGIPYAVFGDALQPVIRSLDPEQISLLARGATAELSSLFPFLAPGAPRASQGADDPAEYKTRLFWTFAEFLKSLARKTPLLLLLDDVHWADTASLELLHFVARQTIDQPILVVCTYNSAEREHNATLRSTERSLGSVGVARTHVLAPLTLEETIALVQQMFSAQGPAVGAFAQRLFDFTEGNAFFINETLQTLIDAGKLREVGGSWSGWQIERFDVAPNIRDAVMARLDGLSAAARQAADTAAVLGNRFDLKLFQVLNRSAPADTIAALDELRTKGMLVERAGATIEYDFAHPIYRQALYAALGMGRAKLLHAQIADSLEAYYGAAAPAHADELAYHFARAELAGRASKAVDYLASAGSSALQRSADREAANYLALALELLGYGDGAATSDRRYLQLVAELARAKQRVGEFEEAVRLFGILLTAAAASGNHDALAEAERRLGLANFWAGRHAAALQRFDAADLAATTAGDDRLRARILLARGAAYQELGRADDAKGDIEEALRIAESIHDDGLRARALRTLLLLHTWTGPPDLARKYGGQAIELAGRTGATDVLFLAYWTMAVLEGLTGDPRAMRGYIEQAEEIAAGRNSPLMQLWCDELAIEHAFAVGDWSGGIARGEAAVALARDLNQRTILPRLLVWTSLMYLGRGELDKARAFIDESWQLSGAEGPIETLDVHTVVPAHIGRASYHMAQWQFEDAIRVAEAGLAVADRSGYPFWAIHRVLPIIAEACCHILDLEKAARVEERMRRDSERLGHKLGLAWAQACRAIMVWRAGDPAKAVSMLQDAADRLDAIPILPDAARLRRQLAGRLAEVGDRQGALKELRHVHEVFVQLGAEFELDKARGQFRELGAKPPTREVSEGAEGLTSRELDIARLVANRKSNKAIGNALDISPRTVSTHLSNIFRKLEVGSRAELADYLRQSGLLDG